MRSNFLFAADKVMEKGCVGGKKREEDFLRCMRHCHWKSFHPSIHLLSITAHPVLKVVEVLESVSAVSG